MFFKVIYQKKLSGDPEDQLERRKEQIKHILTAFLS